VSAYAVALSLEKGTYMKKLVASILCLALVALAAPINLIAAAKAAQGGKGQISGVATLEGKPIPNVTVRLRNVDTDQLVGNMTANGAGEFSFTGLPEGNYVVETVSANGTVLGTSTVAITAATLIVANLTLGSSAAAVAAAGGSAAVLGGTVAAAGVGAGLGTGLIITTVVAAGLGVTGVAVVLNDASASQ
jgi:hypothetical protein